MNISILAKNLEKTIAGKERYRNHLNSSIVEQSLLIQFLDANLVELNKILTDVNIIKKSMENSKAKEEE